MDLAKVIHELHEELEHLNAAIVSLERLQEAAQRGSASGLLGEEVERPARGKRKRKSEAQAEGGQPE